MTGKINKVSPVEDLSSQVVVNSSTIASYGAIKVKKYEKVVHVFFANYKFKAAGNNQVVLSGLPIASAQVGCVPTGINASESGQLFASGDVGWIRDGEGILNMHIGSAYSKSHWTQFTYIEA